MDFKISNQPMQLTKKTSFAGTLFEAGFLIVLIIVGYLYLVSPKQAQYSDLRSQKKSLEERKTNLERQSAVFDNLVEQLANEKDSVAKVDDMLPLESRPSRLYVLLEDLTQSASLGSAVVTVETSPQVVVSGEVGGMTTSSGNRAVQKIPLSISAAGTMEQLSNLLRLLEISSRVIQVKSLDISQGSGDQLIFKIGAESYSYLPAK
jgi:Tfp pilus assembly protein PilO